MEFSDIDKIKLKEYNDFTFVKHKLSKSVEEVLTDFKKAHINEKLDYSLITKFQNGNQLLPIYCHEKDENGNEHGLFWQTYKKHYLCNHGCPICNGGIKKPLSYYIKRSQEIHKNEIGNPLYDYSLIKKEIKNKFQKVPIICPKHGVYYQSFSNHIYGKNGCPICKYSKMEQAVQNYLLDNNIEFIPQCNYNTLPWLKCEEYNRRGLTLDFYLPTYQVAIECQGEQHFKARENSTVKMMSEEIVEKIKYRDEVKFKLCKDNGVNLFYYSNLNLPYPHKIYNDLKLLFQDIENLNKNN